MKHTLGIASLSLVLGCRADTLPGQNDVTMSHGATYEFASSQIAVASGPDDVIDPYAIDLNGDGRPDNRFGILVGGLRQIGIDLQANVDLALHAGDEIELFELQTADSTLTSDDLVGVKVATASPTSPPRFDGSDAFSVDTTVPPATLFGKLVAGVFSSNNPVTTSHPVSLRLRLSLFDINTPVELPLNGAHVQFSTTMGRLRNGQIHGSIRKSDVGPTLIPGIAMLLTRKLQTECPPVAKTCSQVALFLKQEVDRGSHANGPCVNPDGSTSAGDDGVIGYCEVTSSQEFIQPLAPDVQIFDANGNYAPNPQNSSKDSYSVAIGFTAVSSSR